MTIANVSRPSVTGLPDELRTAQEAIHRPEVQEMLRRLSDYRLGIFMPHMHDEHTGDFRPLPDEVIQVESGLEVSFQPTVEIVNRPDRFLPVGWLWRAGAATPATACEMVWDGGQGDAVRQAKHKMSKGD